MNFFVFLGRYFANKKLRQFTSTDFNGHKLHRKYARHYIKMHIEITIVSKMLKKYDHQDDIFFSIRT